MEEKKTTRFAGNLTALRRKAGETQNDLAEVLGVSNKTVSKWETCESEPELSMLTEIAAHYDSLDEADQDKDWRPFNSMLLLLKKFDGLRIYKLN